VTDRRTDGQTEFSSLDRVCIPYSAVKTTNIIYLKISDILATTVAFFELKTFR